METKLFKGEVREYDTKTQEITTRTWRKKFTENEVKDWMEGRRRWLRDIYEFDEIKWDLWHDGCYRMSAYRFPKKSSQSKRQLKPKAVCYIFTPIS